jgi:release factor glutamine methyltransferase
VLIPRPETEELVDRALARAPQGGRVIDLGTGSGAIAIAVAVARPDLQVLAVDQSQDALLVAAANVARHGVGARVTLLQGSWWAPVPADATFDVVVSNPPYIDPNATDGLAADVRKFEPAMALFSAPGDVLSCYRAIGAGLAQHLRPAGFVVCETGLGAAEPGLSWLASLPFLRDAQLLPDLAGLPRFLVAQAQGVGA